MFAVVFEVLPDAGKKDEYVGLAKQLRPLLEETDGFLSVDRFESRSRAGWMLSASFWRDEKSVVRWRSQGEHHAIQLHGRDSVFADYHLRVGEVTSDSGARDFRQKRFDETEVGTAKALGITEVGPVDGMPVVQGVEAVAAHLGLDLNKPTLVGQDVFESIYTPGKLLLLTSWKTAADADRWEPRAATESGCALRHRRMRSIRDYGLFDRREAFQFCPVVRRC